MFNLMLSHDYALQLPFIALHAFFLDFVKGVGTDALKLNMVFCSLAGELNLEFFL